MNNLLLKKVAFFKDLPIVFLYSKRFPSCHTVLLLFLCVGAGMIRIMVHDLVFHLVISSYCMVSSKTMLSIGCFDRVHIDYYMPLCVFSFIDTYKPAIKTLMCTYSFRN